jgi:hypothetical protein
MASTSSATVSSGSACFHLHGVRDHAGNDPQVTANLKKVPAVSEQIRDKSRH